MRRCDVPRRRKGDEYKPDWTTLAQAATQLWKKHPGLGSVGAEETVQNAIRSKSRQQFVRGMADGKASYELIESIESEATINVVFSEIRRPGWPLPRCVWWNAQVLWEPFLSFVETKLLPFESFESSDNRNVSQKRSEQEKATSKFVAKYIREAKAEGEPPTLVGAENAAEADGLHVPRRILHDALRRKIDVKVGRPKKLAKK
jgi:hypothetical protein